MGFGPVYGSIFDFRIYYFVCTFIGFPFIGTIGVNIPMDVNDLEKGGYFRYNMV